MWRLNSVGLTHFVCLYTKLGLARPESSCTLAYTPTVHTHTMNRWISSSLLWWQTSSTPSGNNQGVGTPALLAWNAISKGNRWLAGDQTWLTPHTDDTHTYTDMQELREMSSLHVLISFWHCSSHIQTHWVCILCVFPDRIWDTVPLWLYPVLSLSLWFKIEICLCQGQKQD